MMDWRDVTYIDAGSDAGTVSAEVPLPEDVEFKDADVWCSVAEFLLYLELAEKGRER